MATPQEKLAASLQVLRELQNKNKVAFKTGDISRTHRERLLMNNFIQEVLPGWYIFNFYNNPPGSSTSWYLAYWDFCAQYLNDRFGENYCLSAEHSIAIHTEDLTIPQQLIIRSTEGNNLPTSLPFNTSLFAYKSPLPNNAEIETVKGLRVLTLPTSIIQCSRTAYQKNPIEMRTALTQISDSSELLGILLENGSSTIAGTIAGAYRNIGNNQFADKIVRTMKATGYDIRENDPFENPTLGAIKYRYNSAYAVRIQLMWEQMREEIIQIFPKPNPTHHNTQEYLHKIDELYTADAYHSLSIEKYNVSEELIEKVKNGQWDVQGNSADNSQRDAMAASGYHQAFQAVKNSIEKIMQGENPGEIIHNDHGEWYLKLFSASVNAGILKPSDLAGYRNTLVSIGSSQHTPPGVESMRASMKIYLELLKQEPNPAVRAVLGHFIFVFIHPYVDGNGRMGRFIMNAMLASGGYPWTIIPVEKRDEYMNALELASVNKDIKPLTKFISEIIFSKS